MAMGPRIADRLELPEDAATQTYGFIARKGGGKTYAAGVLVEQLLELGVPVIVIDPVGNWYGLQIARDGKAEGFAIPVFGGARGNVPIEVDQGDALARLVVSRNLAAVVDVSGFRKNDRKRFVAEFAEALFHEAKSHPTPRMIVFEEAQVFAPQRADRGSERLLGAVEDIVRLGRNYGLGSTLISQRPQSVHKEVLNQVEALFVGQLNGPQERKAISDWVTERGAEHGLLDTLPSLQPGTMVVWSPQWLRVLKKVRIARKRTFDASATPVLGKQRSAEPRVTSLDMQELGAALAALDKTSPAPTKRRLHHGENDAVTHAAPRLAELEAECAQLRARVLDQTNLQQLGKRMTAALQNLQQLAAEFVELLTGDPSTSSTPAVDRPRQARATASAELHAGRLPRPAGARASGTQTALRAGALRMLTALATFHPGVMSRPQIARAAGLRVNSGTFASYWSNLKQQGLLEDAGGGLFRATESGLEALGSARPAVPRTFADRRAFWETRLRAGERRMLDAVIAAGEPGIARDALAEAVQMSVTSGTFASYLSTLSNNRLIARVRDGRVAVHPWLLKGPSAP